MPTLWSWENNKAIPEKLNMVEFDYDYMLQYFEKQKIDTQN